MSDDLLTTIKFEVDASGMSAGLTSIKKSIAELGAKTTEITKKVNTELSNIDASKSIDGNVKKATKALTRELGELEKYIAASGSTVQKDFKNISKSAAEMYINLAGKGLDDSRINAYLEKLLEAQTLAKTQAQQASKSAAEQAAATQKLMAEEDHYADLKRQHAAYNKAIADQRAKELREELALIEQINDATLRMKTTGKAGALPPTYYEAKAGAKPSSGVNDALAALKAEESQLKAITKAEKDRADAAAKTAKDIKDQTAALEAFRVEVQNAELNLTHFGRAKTAAFLQDKGARLGFDPALVQPEIAALKKLEDARAAAFAAANPHIAELAKRAEAAGTSVKGLSASLRNVPAQFTDIIVSLQGGQAPLTVLLQQGGQLKDMFGGIGNAARALGGYVASLINPFSLAAAAVATLGASYYYGSKELDAYNKALILTGNAVGLTSGQLSDMARSMAAVSGTQSKAAEALVSFVNAGATGAANLEKFAAAAIGFEKVTGTAIEETAKQFAKLGEKPLEAAIELNKATGFLTASLYEQIKALEEQGKTTEAAKVVQQAYADTLNQNTAQITANLGTIEKAWNSITSATKGAWDWMMNVGRTAGPAQQLAKLQADVINAENNLKSASESSFGGALSAKARAYAKELQDAQDKLSAFNKTSALSAIRATEQGITEKQIREKIEWDKSHQTQLDKLQQELHKEVEDYKSLQARGEESAKTRLQYEQRIRHLVKQQADYLKGEYSLELAKPEKTKTAKAEKVQGFGNELATTKQMLSTQEQMIKDSYSNRQKTIEDAYKAQEISAAQYYVRQLANDEEALSKREAARVEAQARFDAEIARRKQITEARPESKARTTALKDIENETANFAAAQESARQKDANSMAAHSADMARAIDKESKKVSESVDTYLADMQRKAQSDATLQAAREAMAGQAPEIIAGLEAELKVRADAAKVLDQTAEAYALAAKNAREFEGKLQTKFDGGQDATKDEIALLETLQYASKQARENLLKLGGAVDTSALESSITATSASIKAQTDKLAGDITKTLADGIMSAGKDGGEGLRKALEDVLVTKPFRIVVEAILQPISQGIAQGIIGQGVGSGVGEATGLSSVFQTASLAVNTFGKAAMVSASEIVGGTLSFTEGMTAAGELLSSGSYAAGSGTAIGTAGPYAIAAYVAAKTVEALTTIKVSDAGKFLYGYNTADGFKSGGRQDYMQEGGFRGSNKNSEWFDPAPEVAAYMGAVSDAVVSSVKGLAGAIGLSTDAVDGFSKQIEVSVGGLNGPETKAAIDKAFGGLAEDMVQSIFGDQLLALSAPGEDAIKTLVRLGTDLTTVNDILREFGKPLFDISLAGVTAAEDLLKTVGGLDKFTELAGTLEAVNTVLTKLGQSTFDISMDGAKAANDLAKSVGGTDNLSELANGLIHVNENLAKLGEPLLDVSVASARTAHNMLTATDSAVKALEAAEKLESSYASFAKNLSKDPDTTQVASLQAIFDRAMAGVTKFIPSIKGPSDLTSVTYDQYAGYTDPQRTKLDAAASAFKDLQTAIDSAAKTAQSAAKTAQDAAESAAKAYEDALKSVEDSTRDVNRQLRDFGKTDFQKKLSAIEYAGQDKQSELDKLSAKATELSATANALSIKASNLSLDSVATISNDLISASIDLSDSSKEVAGNIKDTLANSTAALGDALTLVPSISSLFDGILAGLLKIPPALQLVSGAVQGVGSAASNASGGLTAFGAAAGMAGSSATSATGPVNSVGAAFSAITPAASAAGAALSALGSAFSTASAALASLTATFGGAASALDGLNASFASAATGLGSLGSAFESAGASGASLAGSLGAVSGAMEGIAGAAAGAAGGLSSAISALSAVAGSASSIQAPIGSAATPAVVVAAASGGAIHGPGTATSDSVPAMLSDGEYVIKASSVDKYGTGFFDALNAGVMHPTVYRAGGTPPSGAVATLTDAQKQLLYLETFGSTVERLGSTFKVFTDALGETTGAAVQASETYTQAVSTLSGAGLNVGGMDAEGVKKLILGLLDANKPTVNPDTGLLEFNATAQKALAPLAGVLGSVETVLKGLDTIKPWQDKLDVLTGETTDRKLALQKDLASTTDTTTQDIIRQVYAQEDLNEARKEEAKALDSVKDALKNFQKESSSLEADLNSAFGTSGGDTAAKTIRKDLALTDVRKSVEDAGLLQSSPTYAAMSDADKLKTNATIKGIRDTAELAEKQYDLNEARKTEITLLGDAKSRLKSYTDAGASKEVEKMRLQGNDAGANAAQKAIDLADVFKSTADATALLATEGLTPLDKAAIQATITTNDATIAQYKKNAALDAEIEILGRYKSAKEDADSTNIELMKAMGNTAGAAAIELANATKGFTDAQTATVRQTNATKGLIAAYGNLSSTADMVTNSRIGLARAKGDTAGADALQLDLDTATYVKSIADATAQLSTATTQAERDILNSSIAADKQSIENIKLSKSLDKEAQAANDAKTAADALASSYADLKKQIENANIELLRAKGDTAAADEAAMALALRDHAGDAYYESLYRELLTIQKLTSARQQLNGMEDTAIQSQIKLIRANGGNALANGLERSAFLKNATAPAAAAQAELDRSKVGFVEFLQSKNITALQGLNSQNVFDSLANDASYENRKKIADLNAPTNDQQYVSGFNAQYAITADNNLTSAWQVLEEFAAMGRTASQQANLQSVVDTAQGIAAAYDLNKSLEGQLKIIELQDEAYKQNLDAQKNLADAQKAYADVLKSTISTMRDFISTLDGGASPLQSLSSARDNFQTVAGKAAAGDTSAYKDLTPAARTFLDLSKNYSKSLVDYQRDEARVRNTLNAVIRVSQSELDKLPKEIAAAADPTKDAWIKLQEATLKETNTSIMLTALSVDSAASKRRLRMTEESLSERYLEAVYMLDEAKRTPLLEIFNTEIAKKVDETVLPEIDMSFNLGDIWGTEIAKVLPYKMSNDDWNNLIAEKFPGLLKSDIVVPLTPGVLTGLIRGVMPEQLTAANLISSTADVSVLVKTKIGEILPTNFAGAKFDAKAMMQAAIDKAMGVGGAGSVTYDWAAMSYEDIAKQLGQSLPNANNLGNADFINGLIKTYQGSDLGKKLEEIAKAKGTYQAAPNVSQDTGTGVNASSMSASAIANRLGLPVNALDMPDYLRGILANYTAPEEYAYQKTFGNGIDQKIADLKAYGKSRGYPGFAAGTNYVPQDMLAQIHEGEAIIPAPFNPAKYGRDSGNDALVAEIKALRAEVENLRKSTEAGQNAIAANTGKTARLMNKFDIDGLPAERT